MTAGQSPAVPSRAAPRPTSVVVVNCSRWPNFVQAVRTDALDLYAADARVAFWDVTMAESEETLIWGQWPKPFAQHPRRFVDELLDRIEQTEEATNERLAVVMVFDRPESLSPEAGVDRGGGAGAGAPAGAKAVKIAIAAMERLSRALVEADPSLRSKVLWIAAFHDAESERERRAAFDVVASPASGPPGRLFETAVYLSSSRGNRRAGDAFTALRILIDLARDEDAARALLRAMPNSRDGRVFLLRPTRVVANPSHETRARLARLIRSTMDAAGSTVEDPAADKVGPIVTKLLERLETSPPGRIVGFTAAPTSGSKKAGDTSVLDAGTVEPASEHWAEVRNVADAERAFARTKGELATLYDARDVNLARERRSLDENARENASQLEELRGAAFDPSFGVSGQVKRHLERARDNLLEKFDALTQDAHRFRDAHTSARVGARAMPDNKLDGPCGVLRSALSAWLPLEVVLVAAGAMAAAFVLFQAPILFARDMNPWTAAPLVVAAIVWFVGWVLIQGRWRRAERHRVEAIVGVRTAQRSAAEDIGEIAKLGLRHVATARLAGQCLPFLTLMTRRAEEIGRVSAEMQRVFAALEREAPPSDSKDEFVATAREKLRTLPQEEAFKTILWDEKPPATTPHELEFDAGRSPLRFQSTLTFRGAVRVENVPFADGEPQPAPIPPNTRS